MPVSSDTLTLTDFVLARIAEDEGIAQAAIVGEVTYGPFRAPEQDDGRWATGGHGSDAERIDGIGITIYAEGGHDADQAAHIARHDPARVLAECEAKRRIVEIAQAQVNGIEEGRPHRSFLSGRVHDGARILNALAQPYSDHPDFRDDWRP